MSKDTRRLARLAEAQGWTVEMTNNGHMRFTSPTGRKYFTGSTPGDVRAEKNFRSTLRRAGLKL